MKDFLEHIEEKLLSYPLEGTVTADVDYLASYLFSMRFEYEKQLYFLFRFR